MVNPLLPLLDIKQKHALQCNAIVKDARAEDERRRGSRARARTGSMQQSPTQSPRSRAASIPGAYMKVDALGATQKKKRRKKKKVELPLVIAGSKVTPSDGTAASLGSPRGGTGQSVMPQRRNRLPTPTMSALENLRDTGKPVTVNDMTEYLRHDYSPPLIQKFTELFRETDVNRDRCLDRAETTAFMTRLYKSTQTDLPPRDALAGEVDAVFEAHDRDENGLLDLGELIDFVRASKLTLMMKKKWRPRVGDEELRLKRELAVNRLKEKQIAAAKAKAVQQRITAAIRIHGQVIMEYEANARAQIENKQHYGARLVVTEVTEETRRLLKCTEFDQSFVALYAQKIYDHKRAIIAVFLRRGRRLEEMIKLSSMKLINKHLAMANAGGKNKKISAEIEALYKAISGGGSALTLAQSLKEITDASQKATHFNDVLQQFGDADDESALQTVMSERMDRGDEVTYSRPYEVEALADRLQEFYNAKFPSGLDVIGEIAENLNRPYGEMMQLASCLFKKHRRKFVHNSPSALLVMVLYTCESINIARILNLAPDAIDTAIYRDINWALRVGHNPRANDAHATLKKWVGFIAVLYTTKVNSDPTYHGKPLFRGIMNLPEAVLNSYLERQVGEYLYWPAATSASADPKVLKNFTDEGNFLIFVFEGWEEATQLWHVSAFPNERELLLPPFTAFRLSTIDRANLKIVAEVKGNLGDGATNKTNYSHSADAAFRKWIRRVVEDKSHEEMATKFLSDQVTRAEIRMLPSEVLQGLCKLLQNERTEWNNLIRKLNPQSVLEKAVVDHAQKMWKFANSTQEAMEYMTRISKADFGDNLTDTIQRTLLEVDEGRDGFGEFDDDVDSEHGGLVDGNGIVTK